MFDGEILLELYLSERIRRQNCMNDIQCIFLFNFMSIFDWTRKEIKVTTYKLQQLR